MEQIRIAVLRRVALSERAEILLHRVPLSDCHCRCRSARLWDAVFHVRNRIDPALVLRNARYTAKCTTSNCAVREGIRVTIRCRDTAQMEDAENRFSMPGNRPRMHSGAVVTCRHFAFAARFGCQKSGSATIHSAAGLLQ